MMDPEPATPAASTEGKTDDTLPTTAAEEPDVSTGAGWNAIHDDDSAVGDAQGDNAAAANVVAATMAQQDPPKEGERTDYSRISTMPFHGEEYDVRGANRLANEASVVAQDPAPPTPTAAPASPVAIASIGHHPTPVAYYPTFPAGVSSLARYDSGICDTGTSEDSDDCEEESELEWAAEQNYNLDSSELHSSGLDSSGLNLDGSTGALRNVHVPPSARTMEYVFQHCTDLEQLFGMHDRVVTELKCRFDGLPIHRICYFHSYHPIEVGVKNLREAIGATDGEAQSPTGNIHDCLGMSPLHILACSTRQNLDLYRLVMEKYPKNLITVDKWEALPVFYALWGMAPRDILQYLIDCHKSLFPDYELNWSMMAESLGMANAPQEAIQRLLDTRSESFPEQSIDWDSVLNKLAEPFRSWKEHYASGETFRFLIRCSILERVDAIGLRQWRTRVMDQIPRIRDGHRSRKADLANFRSSLEYYEGEYHKLKEATLVLELAMWKSKLVEMKSHNRSLDWETCRDTNAEWRNQCRISCGADNVIENVLPYLLPAREA